MDLTSLDFSPAAEQGAKLILRNPITNEVLLDSDGKEMFMTLRGKDSKSYQDIVNKVTNEKFERANRTRKLLGTAEESFNEEIELLSQSTINWNITFNGEKPECTVVNVRKVLTTFSWLREQAQAFVENRANFLKS